MSATFGPGPLLALFGETTGRLQLWDLRQREPIRRLDEGSVIVRSLSFSPDGKLLLLSYDDGSLCVFNTDIDRPRHRLAPNKITLECRCQLHPTAPFAVSYSFWSDLLQVRDLGTGEVRVELKLPWRGSGICTWSLDGSTLAAADGNSGLVNLCSFDPNNPNLRHTGTLKAPGTGGTTVQFNSTGDRVAVRGWDSVVHLFDAVSGRLLFHTRPLPPSSWPELRFDPTGRRLAAARVGS